MTADTLALVNAAAQIATLVVFLATALAALVQIRHLRASNELEALLTISEQMREGALQDAFRYVQTDLQTKLALPAYRRDLAKLGYVDARAHPEMDACNWFNQVGTLVKNRLVDERTFLDMFSRLVIHYWDLLEPAIALLRRERGPAQYENFEYLALLAREWKAKHPQGAYPKGRARLTIADRWATQDAATPD